MNGMNDGNFRQVRARGKVTGRGSPPRVLTSTNLVWGGHWPPRHHVARERCLSFASKHLTCLIWSNHPAVNLPRAIHLSSHIPLTLPGTSLPEAVWLLYRNLLGISRVHVYLSMRKCFISRVAGNRRWRNEINCYLNQRHVVLIKTLAKFKAIWNQ